MKKIVTLCLTAGMLLGVATGASAIDFKAKGQWIMGYGLVDSQFQQQDGSDTFAAQQRVRLQIDAIASESLSGTVSFEMGDTTWGRNGSANSPVGGALGADGRIIELRNAYIDWYVPNTELSIRMGIQPLGLPSVAGGSAILDEQVAGIVASYKINDMASLGFAWARPYNDNWGGSTNDNPANYLDNLDLFTLFVPLKGDGWKVTPWLTYGIVGKNVPTSLGGASAGYARAGLLAAPVTQALGNGTLNANQVESIISDSIYGTAVFAGIPMAFNAGAWNFELDVNYGSLTGLGYAKNVTGQRNNAVVNLGDISADRSGWLAKALLEYKMDWGTPGIFGWYASGDDGELDNGSEMMPYLSPVGNFTSFMGDGNEIGYSIWSGNNLGYDLMLSYSGTWGIGLQLSNFSFMEDLSHTLRVAYWRGTNSPDMVKYFAAVGGSAYGDVGGGGFYLTTHDYLVEVNFDSTYEIYENLDAIVQLGYIFNGIDGNTWNAVGNNEKRDAFRAGIFFNYSF